MSGKSSKEEKIEINRHLERSVQILSMFQAGGTFNGSESAGIPFEGGEESECLSALEFRTKSTEKKKMRENDPVNAELGKKKQNPLSTSVFLPSFPLLPNNKTASKQQQPASSLPSEALQIMKNGHCFMNEGNKRREQEIGERGRERRRNCTREMRSRDCNFGPGMKLHSVHSLVLRFPCLPEL